MSYMNKYPNNILKLWGYVVGFFSFAMLLVTPPALAINYADVVPVPQVLGVNTSIFYPYPSGSLIIDDGTIYVISGVTKIPFTNYNAFKGLGYSLKNVIEGDLTNYTLATAYLINTPNMEHPWGSWLIYKGTVYYYTQEGLIGVPNSEIFTNNGGTWNLIVKANKYDLSNLNNSLPVLTKNDSRVLSAINPANKNSQSASTIQLDTPSPTTSTTTIPTTLQNPSLPQISTPANILAGTSATYTAQATHPNNLPLSYIFTWGDNSLPTTTTTNTASHTYNIKGVYTLMVTVTDTTGKTSSNSITINVDQAPQNTSTSTVRDQQRKKDMETIVNALEQYKAKFGHYPPAEISERVNSAHTESYCGDLSAAGPKFISELENSDILSNVPVDPLNSPIPDDQFCDDFGYTYSYYVYTAGSWGADSAKGNYYVLAVRSMENGGKNPDPSSPGFSTSQRNWQLEYAWVTGKYENPNGGSIITIQAGGTPANNVYPTMQLLINNQVKKTFTNVQGDPNNGIYQTFTYNSPVKININQVKIAFTNDYATSFTDDRNLRVHNVNIDGVNYSTADSSVFGVGSKVTASSCSTGNLQTEWLNCYGYFQFGLPISAQISSDPSAKTRDNQRIADMQTIITALDAYKTKFGTYPTGDVENGLPPDNCFGWDTSSSGSFLSALITGDILSKVPVDPLNTGKCQDGFSYKYFRYQAGYAGADPTKGPYYVLGINKMETSVNPHSTSPGWTQPGNTPDTYGFPRNWQYEFTWVTGKYEGNAGSQRDNQRIADMQTIVTALDGYKSRYGNFPDGETETGCYGWDTSPTGSFIPALTNSSVITKVPTDPLNNGSCQNGYVYRYFHYAPGYGGSDPAKGSYYVLGFNQSEASQNKNPNSPGFSNPQYNYQTEFSWVTGKYENP